MNQGILLANPENIKATILKEGLAEADLLYFPESLNGLKDDGGAA